MSKWVTAWGVPTSYVTEGIGNIMEDTTFRNVFYCPIKGEKVRIRFTNKYGDRDVKLDAVSIGEWKGRGPAVVPETLANFTFNDNGNIIKPGEELVTDAVDYVLEPGKQYVYTITVTPADALKVTLRIKPWNELNSSYDITF